MLQHCPCRIFCHGGNTTHSSGARSALISHSMRVERLDAGGVIVTPALLAADSAPRYHSPSAQPMSPIPRMGSLLPPPVPMRKRPRSPAEARVMEQSGSRMCDPDMNLHLHKRYLSEVGEAGASPTARRPTSHMPAVTFASEGAMFVASSPDMLWNGRRGILSTAGCKLCHARSTRISVWD